MMDDRIHNAKEIRKLLPAEVIGEIPAIVNASEARAPGAKTVMARMGDGGAGFCYHTGGVGVQLLARLTVSSYV